MLTKRIILNNNQSNQNSLKCFAMNMKLEEKENG